MTNIFTGNLTVWGVVLNSEEKRKIFLNVSSLETLPLNPNGSIGKMPSITPSVSISWIFRNYVLANTCEFRNSKVGDTLINFIMSPPKHLRPSFLCAEAKCLNGVMLRERDNDKNNV